MAITLSNAPVSWGVDYVDDPANPSWEKVMDEISTSGYRQTELGPYGYYPTVPEQLEAELGKRGLTIPAGFVFQRLHEPSEADKILLIAQKTVDLLSSVGGKFLVTIDHISEERMATAGQRNRAARLDRPRHRHMIDLIDRIADMALARGVTPVIHQHAGCFIEFEDELDELLHSLDSEKVGICIDTGHMVYAGIDPILYYRANATRVKYFHFKDIDPAVHARALQHSIPFLEAVKQNVFCPMGKGVVEWASLASVLKDTNYHGSANVEQDIDPEVSLSPLVDAKASRSYLESVGF